MTADKSELRREARRRRAEAHRADGIDAAARLAERLLPRSPIPFEAVVGAYWPIGDEIDPRPLVQTLRERGHRLALPVVIERGQPLIFREWDEAWPLDAGPHGTSQPSVSAPVLRPTVLLVPLLAFDRRGFRLGYGGGYYDRTLAALRAQGKVWAIGLAFATQEVDELPETLHDERLDAVATDREWIEVRR